MAGDNIHSSSDSKRSDNGSNAKAYYSRAGLDPPSKQHRATAEASKSNSRASTCDEAGCFQKIGQYTYMYIYILIYNIHMCTHIENSIVYNSIV